MVARRGKCPKNHFFCIFGLLSYKYNLHQVGLEFRQLFDILVHPTSQTIFVVLSSSSSESYLGIGSVEGCPGCRRLQGACIINKSFASSHPGHHHQLDLTSARFLGVVMPANSWTGALIGVLACSDNIINKYSKHQRDLLILSLDFRQI